MSKGFDLAYWASCDLHMLAYLIGDPGCVRCQLERGELPKATVRKPPVPLYKTETTDKGDV